MVTIQYTPIVPHGHRPSTCRGANAQGHQLPTDLSGARSETFDRRRSKEAIGSHQDQVHGSVYLSQSFYSRCLPSNHCWPPRFHAGSNTHFIIEGYLSRRSQACLEMPKTREEDERKRKNTKNECFRSQKSTNQRRLGWCTGLYPKSKLPKYRADPPIFTSTFDRCPKHVQDAPRPPRWRKPDGPRRKSLSQLPGRWRGSMGVTRQ